MHFIYKPNFGNLADKGLQYKDVITYIGIRSFYNEKDKFCFPSYRTIVKLVGCSIKFLRESIERLQCAGYLRVLKVGRMRPKHYYKFEYATTLTRIPLDLLMASELSIGEKATLVILHEHCPSGVSCASINDVAAESGLILRTLKSNFQSLILKGYVVDTYFEDLLNSTIVNTFGLTEKLKWNWTTKSCNHSEANPEEVLNFVMKVISTSRTR